MKLPDKRPTPEMMKLHIQRARLDTKIARQRVAELEITLGETVDDLCKCSSDLDDANIKIKPLEAKTKALETELSKSYNKIVELEKRIINLQLCDKQDFHDALRAQAKVGQNIAAVSAIMDTVANVSAAAAREWFEQIISARPTEKCSYGCDKFQDVDSRCPSCNEKARG